MRPSRVLLKLLSICCFAIVHSSIVLAADIEVGGAFCSLAECDQGRRIGTDAARRRLPGR